MRTQVSGCGRYSRDAAGCRGSIYQDGEERFADSATAGRRSISPEKIPDWLDQLSSGDEELAAKAAQDPPEDDAGALRGLKIILKSADSDARYWATSALAKIPNKQAGEILAALLADNDASVQQCAALALAGNPQENAMDDLLSQLSNPSSQMRRLAGNALIALGDKATRGLHKTLEDGIEIARIETVRALAHIGDQRSITLLFQLLDQDSTIVKYWAEEGLDRLGIGMKFFSPN
jgi:HEAT repeat protein